MTEAAQQTVTVDDDDPNADLRAILDKALSDDAPAEADTEGLDAPVDDDSPRDKIVSARKAAEIADDLSIKRSRGDAPAEKAEQPPAEPKAETDAPPAAAKADDAKPADMTALDATALLEGVDAGRAAEITRRLGEAQPLRDLYDRHKGELAAHGETPEAAMGRLIDINRYAMQNGADYLAWFAGTVLPDDQREAALTKAVAPFGYKLVKDDQAPAIDDAALADDEYDDDSVKKLKAFARDAARKLKDAPKQAPALTGPDAPEIQRTNALNGWINAKGADGQPVRPLFETLATVIGARSEGHVRTTGKAVTLDDLDRIYREEETKLRERLGFKPTSAAQAEPAVADQSQKAAADAEAARRASKSVDGSGQGASRRPAAPGHNDDIAALVADWKAKGN